MPIIRIPASQTEKFKSFCKTFALYIESLEDVRLRGNVLLNTVSQSAGHDSYKALLIDAKTYGEGGIEWLLMPELLTSSLAKALPATPKGVFNALSIASAMTEHGSVELRVDIDPDDSKRNFKSVIMNAAESDQDYLQSIEASSPSAKILPENPNIFDGLPVSVIEGLIKEVIDVHIQDQMDPWEPWNGRAKAVVSRVLPCLLYLQVEVNSVLTGDFILNYFETDNMESLALDERIPFNIREPLEEFLRNEIIGSIKMREQYGYVSLALSEAFRKEGFTTKQSDG